MIKKSGKCLHVSKLYLPLHPQSRKQFFESLETNVAKGNTDVGSKRCFEKKFSKKFLKNLVVQKISLTFAPLSDMKKMIGDFSNGSLIYWFLQRENVVFICQFL